MGAKNSRNIGFLGFLVIFSLFINLLWGIAFCYTYWVGSERKSPDMAVFEHCPACKHTFDTIAAAQEMGRLDLISLLLAAFAIIIGITAVSWFAYIRGEARREAREEIEEKAEEIIHKWLDKNPKHISSAAEEFIKRNPRVLADISAEENAGNEVAMAVENGIGND